MTQFFLVSGPGFGTYRRRMSNPGPTLQIYWFHYMFLYTADRYAPNVRTHRPTFGSAKAESGYA